ncbi:MAG: hypothetical protein AAFZ15_18090 [Bacteroidota bacterium]
MRHNPFGGLTDQELRRAIVPNDILSDIIKDVESKESYMVQLVGKKGRGKTLHLKILQQLFDEYPIYLLDENIDLKTIDRTESKIFFIDSIQHIRFMKRIQLYRRAHKIVFTTHHHRLHEFFLAGTKHKTYLMKGLDEQVLGNAIKKRIAIAADINDFNQVEINQKLVRQLLRKYGDDFRSILNYLYDQFKHAHYDCR